MIVEISDKKTGKVVAKLPIELGGMNYTPSETELFNEAWRCAVDDKSVDSAKRDDYAFRSLAE